MPEKTHYDDNILFLRSLIRTLHDAIRLNVDIEYFANKILEDILFINSSIEKIYDSLKKNSLLIRRNVYYHSIMKLKEAYVHFLNELHSTNGRFRKTFEHTRANFSLILENNLKDLQDIKDFIGGTEAGKVEGDAISRSELHYLMSPIENPSDSLDETGKYTISDVKL
ncbi:hypothetical protein S1OALGB6SA_1466 [Olavius algarvensis spirochete endosymbiont]|uniref:hypothetical protein n=1 Tax=Olavius algarvensis spirochete endosymbiont TaxID=260710 RepID=UPI00052B994E|nr:hypothetical protein [Olavius algarvensis spirochete endosymbiont]KGM42670.1 hypothetical protein JY97_12360 [Alkalispirochaeta odontotermitis]VDB00388.1 hypothetical protein S1OALGB6SA_1466 [Olavius algarvensis spirochete endosymbiont]